MMHISKTQKIALVAGSVLLLTCVGYVLLYKHLSALEDKLIKVKTDLVAIEELERNKLGISMLLDSTQKGREELSTYFVLEDDPTPFLELIETLGAETGVVLEVETLSIDKTSSETGVLPQDNMQVVLLVEGSWESLYRFLELLEHMPFMVEIANTAFKVDETNDRVWKGQVELLCSAK